MIVKMFLNQVKLKIILNPHYSPHYLLHFYLFKVFFQSVFLKLGLVGSCRSNVVTHTTGTQQTAVEKHNQKTPLVDLADRERTLLK